MNTKKRQIILSTSILMLLLLLCTACGSPAVAEKTEPTATLPPVTSTPTVAPTTVAATPTVPDGTPATYQPTGCTNFNVGPHSQALASQLYENKVYGFSMYYNGDKHNTNTSIQAWDVTETKDSVEFFPSGVSDGANLSVRLDDLSTETPEGFIHRLIGPISSHQECSSSDLSFNNGALTWKQITVAVTETATGAHTKQLYLAAKNPKSGKVLGVIFTCGSGTVDSANAENLRYMMDMFTFI